MSVSMSESNTRAAWARLPGLGLPLLGALTTLAVWWAATEVFDIRPFLLPAPPDIVTSFLGMPDYLLHQAWVTLRETLIGFGLAVVFGMLLASLLCTSRIIERATLPLLVSANAVPKLAIAPLLMVWLGFGTFPKVVMVVLVSFFPIVVATMSGLTATPVELGELAASLTASRWRTFVKIRVPWALPQIFIGLKVAVSLAMIGAVVAEFTGSDQGLGYVIVASGASADTPLAFAAIVLLAVMSVSLFYLVAAAQRLLLPWAREITG